MGTNNESLTPKQARTVFFQDGALDIIAGATLLNFGFDVLGGSTSSSLFTWFPILLFASVKNRNTLPRISSELKNISDKQLRIWTIIPTMVLALMLVLLGTIILSDTLALAELRYPLGFAVVVLLALIPVFWVNQKQFYIYAAVSFAAGLITFFISMPAIFFFVTAAVMLFFGGRMMMQFSRKYTQPEE